MASDIPADDADRRERILAGWLSLGVGTLIFAAKLFAYERTGSSAVLSDALESIVNVVAAALLVYSLIVASRPADRNHPYGHGKVEFFSAGFEGAMIVFAAGLILFEAIRELIRGPELERIGLGLVVLGAAAVANGLLGAFLIRLGKKHGSLALEADGRHVFTDVVTSGGVVIGLAAVWWTGWLWLDPVIAILVALQILFTGYGLMRRAVGGLMDEADPETLERVVRALETDRPAWCIDVHGLRAWRSGNDRHVDLHLSVPRYFDVQRLHAIDDELEAGLLAEMGVGGDVMLHFDPCLPSQCPTCLMEDCPVRSAPAGERPAIRVESAVRSDEAMRAAAASAVPA